MDYQKEYYLKHKTKINEKQHEYYQKHRVTVLQKQREYNASPDTKKKRNKHYKLTSMTAEKREYNKLIMRKWRKNNPLKVKENNKKCYWWTHEKRRTSSKKTLLELRNSIYSILGDSCVECGIFDKRVLQFDHINGGGNMESKRFKSNTTMLRRYRDEPNKCREQLQVLCANCNWIKKHENHETTEKYGYY